MSRTATMQPTISDDGPTEPLPQVLPGAAGRLVITLVHAYQLARSGRPTGCRYLPTCSEYAIEAITEHGTFTGLSLTLRRLSRCTPWGGHGIDPVPTGRATCTHH